jgi:hypothetical protein
MTAISFIILVQGVLISLLFSSPVMAFAGVHQTTVDFLRDDYNLQIRHWIRRRRSCHSSGSCLSAKGDGDETEEEKASDPLTNDRREGMADAFAALDSLTADDFDDVKPNSLLGSGNTGAFANSLSVEESAKLFMEMQNELSSLGGEDGVYGDILGDLEVGDASGIDDVDAPGEYEVTSLGLALDEAVGLIAAADSPSDASNTFVLNDADGIGSALSSNDKSNDTSPLTIADVTAEILTQEIKTSLSMEEFISSAIQQAVGEIDSTPEKISSASGAVGRTGDIAKAAGELLENEELRREIGKIFDEAGKKLRLEVETMKKEQVSTSFISV